MKKHFLDYIDHAQSRSARGLRILVEYFFALEQLEPVRLSGIHSVSVFGSARVKTDSPEYLEAKKLGRLLYENGFGVITGGSQGIMEAANAGAAEGILEAYQAKHHRLTVDQIKKTKEFQRKLKLYSVGLQITLPFEQDVNPFVGVMATFHYFMIRKFFFATLSSAFIACEGGWGTRDEFFEILTLVQTGKAPLMPIIYVTPHPQHLQADVDYAVKHEYISEDDLALLDIVSSHKKAVEIIKNFYRYVRNISYDQDAQVQIFLKHPLSQVQKKRITRLVSERYSNLFEGGVKFFHDRFELRDYRHPSYGVVRKIIDAL